MPPVVALLALAACSGPPAWESPEAKDWIHVQASPNNGTCGIHENGTAECWGEDVDLGMLPPDGPLLDIAVAHLVYGIDEAGELVVGPERDDGVIALDLSGLNDGTRYVDVAAGSAWVCGLTDSGAIRCTGSSPVVSAVSGWGGFAQISGGSWYLCGRYEDGSASCWDLDSEQTDRLGPYTTLDSGQRGACGIADFQDLRCWGDVYVSDDLGPFKDVSVGTAITCVIDLSSDIRCWWDPRVLTSVVPPDDGPFAAVAAGTFQVCGLRTDGGISCTRGEEVEE